MSCLLHCEQRTPSEEAAVKSWSAGHVPWKEGILGKSRGEGAMMMEKAGGGQNYQFLGS